MKKLVLLGVMIVLVSNARAAAEENSNNRPWKFTAGEYFYDGYSGTDVNLRWREDDTNAWLGMYSDRQFGTQARAGFDTSIDLAHHVQLQPSLQIATLGFFGGSINLQVGGSWFGIVGMGRTNLKPYFNLNFDPNDAITVGTGYRTSDGNVYTIFVVADDRLHTQQRDWHFNARISFIDKRLTLDLLRKSGLSDIGPIAGWGFSSTWDWGRWFVRLARDPNQNFSAQDAWRIAAGVRF